VGIRNYIIFIVTINRKYIFNRLRGKLPFNANDRKQFFDIVCNTDAVFDDAWKFYTDPCRDFVKNLLNRDFRARLTSQQCLLHPWILMHKQVLYKSYIFII